jgi:hypothetical protein
MEIIAGDTGGIEAGVEAGDMAGVEAGEIAGETAGEITPGEPDLFEVELDTMISGLVIRDAWPLGDRWVILCERGLLLWSPSLDPTPSIAGAPPEVSVSEGVLTTIRFITGPEITPPNGAPLSALQVAGQNALAFRDELWVMPHQEGADGESQAVAVTSEEIRRWERSPLSELFSSATGVTWFNNELWLSDDSGVGRWRASDESWSRFDTLAELARFELSSGPWTEGEALWALAPPSDSADRREVYAVAQGSKWSHETWWSELSLASVNTKVWGRQDGYLAGGHAGDMWTLSSHPLLRSLSIDALWSGGDSMDESGQALWMLSEGRLWRANAAALNSQDPRSEEASVGYALLSGRWWGGHATDANTLHIWGPDGLARASIERAPYWATEATALGSSPVQTLLRGVNYDEAAQVVAWLSIEPPDETDLTLPEMTWDLSDSQGVLTLSRDELDPELSQSSTLWLVAYIDRGEDQAAQVASLRLEVIPMVTWSGDLLPIFDRSCATCHDGRGGARDLSMTALWINDIEDIILVTDEGSMPIGLPALSTDEVSLIQRWRDDGFPE